MGSREDGDKDVGFEALLVFFHCFGADNLHYVFAVDPDGMDMMTVTFQKTVQLVSRGDDIRLLLVLSSCKLAPKAIKEKHND